MSAFISMLRAINVGGKKMIPMDSLCAIYEDLGFTRVRTYIQSGNVVFESSQDDVSRLTTQIEGHIEQSVGYPVKVIIRRPRDFQRILNSNPFLKDRNEDQDKLYVTFLYQPPPSEAWDKLMLPANTIDEFARGDQAVYLFLPNYYGRTKLSNSFFEKKLGVPATTRNWNTVGALYRIASEK